jgi:hypothetical protein
MIGIPDLYTSLLELAYETRDSEIRLILGGGFGLYLKAEYIRQHTARTLLQQAPEARSTNDLDLFLRPELLIRSAMLQPLADALQKLGYQVVEGRAKYQFSRHTEDEHETGAVKVDLLTGPRSCFNGTAARVDERRVRPSPSVGVHAHPVNEALTLEDGLLPVRLSGQLEHGPRWDGEIHLPQPYTFLMMKLFAFRDRLQDEAKDYGQYHALDLYSILATTTEDEWEAAKALRDQYRAEAIVVEARSIVQEHFSMPTATGILRLKSSPYCREELQIDDFISALIELFPAP